MIEIASLIIVNLIIAAGIGFFIGYLIGKNSSIRFEKQINDKNKSITPRPFTKPKSMVNPIFKKNSNVDNKPLILTTPRQSGRDNFLKIRGINSEIMQMLNDLGIYHFDQISNWNNKNCDWVEELLHLQGRIRAEQWVDQAKILASGKETAFSMKIDNPSLEDSDDN